VHDVMQQAGFCAVGPWKIQLASYFGFFYQGKRVSLHVLGSKHSDLNSILGSIFAGSHQFTGMSPNY
jgi:hypothetical protein